MRSLLYLLNYWCTFTALMGVGAVGVSAQQATLKGVVIDNETRRPIPLVNIYLRGTSVGTTTNDSGEFTLSIPGDEKQTVAFSHIGYKKGTYEVELTAGEEFNADIELEPEAVQMGEVVVVAPKTHEERTASYVITEQQIESYSALNIHDVLRRFTPQVSHSFAYYASLRKESGFTLYVDNFHWDPMFVDAIDPYIIKKILVWRHGWAPIWFRKDPGSHYVVQVITR